MSRSAIGIDVGGTKTALALVAPDGTVRSSERLYMRDAAGPDELLASIAARSRALAAETDVAGIGVALPEVLDLDGELQSHVSVSWTRRTILDALGRVAPVALEADVRAAALAEARIGAGRGHASVGYVSVGTGVSCALVLGGTPYAGAHGAAQLLGSAELPMTCPHCGRSFRASALEDVAAGPPLVRRFNAEAGRSIERGEELLALAADGDDVARRTIDHGAELLGAYVALFVNLVDPELVVVGGGFGSALGPAWETLVSAARDHVWATHVRDVPIVPAELGEHAGVVGAGLLAHDAAARR